MTFLYPGISEQVLKPDAVTGIYESKTLLLILILTHMKSISAKLLALLLLVLLTAVVTVKAGSGRHHGRHEGRHQGPAAREIRAYYQENVLPVVRQQRQKLEPQLAAADQAQLATYRTQLKDLRQRGQALRQSFHATGGGEGARPALTDAQRQQFQQLHTDQRAIMENVAKLAEKYEAAIKKLAEEVGPQREKWAADIKAIIAKTASPEQLERMKGHEARPGRHGHLGKAFRPARFLLLDPSAPAAATRDLGAASVYPNPAGPSSQLDYEVKKAGPVTIELLDARGNKLRTLLQNEKQDKGTHSQVLDARDLPAGTYYYKITTRSGTETKRFVKE
jgi:hypothetical protein